MLPKMKIVALSLIGLLHGLLVTSRAPAVGHFDFEGERYYDPYLQRDGEIPPRDLVRPQDMLMTDKGVFISQMWIIGAQHQSGNVGPSQGESLDPNGEGVGITVLVPDSLFDATAGSGDGYARYRFYANAALRDTTKDLRLMRLADVGTLIDPLDDTNAPSTIDLSTLSHEYAQIPERSPAATVLTHGGFGTSWTGTSLSIGGLTPVSVRGLRWRTDALTAIDESRFYTESPAIDNLDRTRYSGFVGGGDSGSGLYYRNGWQWTLFNNVATGVREIAPELGWIQSQIGSIDPTAATEVGNLSYPPKPVANLVWSPTSGNSWSTAANWTDSVGGLGTAPQFNELQADVVSVESSSSALISTPASARDVFVGSSSVSTAAITLATGGELRADSVFAGAAVDEEGTVVIAGGNVDTAATNVGVLGKGQVLHHAGSHKTHRLVVGMNNKDATGTSTYQLVGWSSATLEADGIELGVHAGSEGTLQIFGGSGASVGGRTAHVGVEGVGSVVQSSGSVTLDWLRLGSSAGGIGNYSLSGGTLNTKRIDVTLGSKLGMSGGAVNADLISVDGELEVSSTSTPLAIDSSLIMQPGSTLSFGNVSATLQFNRITDLRQTTLDDLAGTPTIDLGSSGMLIVDSQIASQIDNGVVNVAKNGASLTSSSNAVFVPSQENELVIDGDVIRGDIELAAPASVVNAGEFVYASDAINIMGGLLKDSISTVDLGANSSLVASTGRLPGEFRSLISTGPTGPFSARYIEVADTGWMSINGYIEVYDTSPPAFTVRGTLEVGDSTAYGTTGEATISGPSGSDAILVVAGAEANLAFDIGTAASDSLDVAYLAFSDLAAGAIQLNIPTSDALSLEMYAAHELVSADTNSGVFLSVTLGGDVGASGMISFAELEAGANTADPIDGRALAVAYRHQTGPGKAIESFACDGVCAVLAYPGDANLDGFVDFDDFLLFSPNYETLSGMTWADGDFNGDGAVTFDDFLLMSPYYENVAHPGGATGGAAPEPVAALLAIIALCTALPSRFDFRLVQSSKTTSLKL